MRLVLLLIISLVSAILATAAIIILDISQPLALGACIAAATIVPTLIAALPRVGVVAGGDADSAREEGTVKWFNVSKGFGFIARENGEEIFVHFRSIQDKNQGRRALKDGQRVSFIVEQSDKGPQAEEVIGL